MKFLHKAIVDKFNINIYFNAYVTYTLKLKIKVKKKTEMNSIKGFFNTKKSGEL